MEKCVDECPKNHTSKKIKNDVSLHELRGKLEDFARVRGWEQYHSPRNLLLALVSNSLSFIFEICSIKI